MNNLNNIKYCLDLNTNITENIKERIYTLVEVMSSKVKEIDLVKLGEKLKTLKIDKLSKFERKGIYYYDAVLNTAFIDPKKLENNVDADNVLVKVLLEAATSTGKYTGFNSDERLRALNLAYTEILANYIIGNEGNSDLEEEVFIANLISFVVGKDTMFDSYFSNNGGAIIKAMLDVEVGL